VAEVFFNPCGIQVFLSFALGLFRELVSSFPFLFPPLVAEPVFSFAIFLVLVAKRPGFFVSFFPLITISRRTSLRWILFVRLR